MPTYWLHVNGETYQVAPVRSGQKEDDLANLRAQWASPGASSPFSIDVLLRGQQTTLTIFPAQVWALAVWSVEAPPASTSGPISGGPREYPWEG